MSACPICLLETDVGMRTKSILLKQHLMTVSDLRNGNNGGSLCLWGFMHLECEREQQT